MSEQEHKQEQVQGRMKTLTEAGQGLYETNFRKYLANFDKVWSLLETIPEKINNCSDNLNELKKLDEELSDYSQSYWEASKQLVAFLTRSSTEESFQERDTHLIEYERGKDVIENLHKLIKHKRIECMENLSVCDTGSLRTRSAASSSSYKGSFRSPHDDKVLTKKRMEVEAQRAKLKFVERENDIHKQMSSLQTQLTVLRQERKTAIVEAELNVVENKSCNSSPARSVLDALPSENVDYDICNQRIASYIEEQRSYSGISHNHNNNDTVAVGCNEEPRVYLNPSVPGFQPTVTVANNDHNQPSVINNITQFLLKKDLLLSRFINYDDKPESYACWKASFQTITRELSVSPFEEIDLLIKWLGPQSSKFALSIRVANANNPERGLQRIWERLEERYGCPELVESALKNKLLNFPRLGLKDSKRLFELSDILSEVESIKENPKYSTMLSYCDSSSGILPIINKLPYNLQEKWTSKAANYKKMHDVSYPPFSVVVEFVREMAKIRNDPGFQYETRQRVGYVDSVVRVKKTGTTSQGASTDSGGTEQLLCPIHKSNNHRLDQCYSFKGKSIAERRKILKKLSMCFRCCSSKVHMARDCRVRLHCNICKSDKHHSAMHIHASEVDRSYKDRRSGMPGELGVEKSVNNPHGGEKPVGDCLSSNCTQICKTGFKGKSCAKIVLVKVYSELSPEKSLHMYAIIDDQSNRSLAKSEFFNFFGVDTGQVDYTLSSCSGVETATGRRASGFVVQSLDEDVSLPLPTLIECDNIPSSRDEIPTPEVAENYAHLRSIVPFIPPIDNKASILLLIGRDLPRAHHVLDQRIGSTSPYAQKLHLGWVLVGESCLDKVHVPENVVVNRTYVLPNGRSSILAPCDSSIIVKEQFVPTLQTSVYSGQEVLGTASDLFDRTPEDNKPGLSVNDREFMKVMDSSFSKNEEGHWIAPLPFCSDRKRLPNNRVLALRRAAILDQSLNQNSVKREHFYTFMGKLLDSNYAELAPALSDNEECWYLPIFGVYNDKKPGKVRVVFDSAAKFEGVSLNDVLLAGPDLTNSLVGVLMRFRKEKIAITADIEQMFFGFVVAEKDRNYLRFLWHRDNNPLEGLVEYRMCRHVFGNAPSPTIATLGLRKSVDSPDLDNDVKYFVKRNFYVDDALTSVPSTKEAISLMSRTQSALYQGGHLRLHKVSSNSVEVVQAFSVEDRSNDLKELDLSMEKVPLQRSLGISWNLQCDIFTFQVKLDSKPFTRRGILSTLHTVFDPLGFVAPVILQGRLLFRELTDISGGWDDVLPHEYNKQWMQWTNSLCDLANLEIRRPYVPFSVVNSQRRDIHVFSDASEKAVSAVAYIRVFDTNNEPKVGFVLGKSKLAPKSGHTIPRLELCAAVLGCELASTILDQLDITIDNMYFYSDSKVVLGYICNRTRRFYTYVSNRVDKILKLSKSDQWNYVPSHLNPADVGSRGIAARDLPISSWLNPSVAAFQNDDCNDQVNFPLVDSYDDSELRPVVVLKIDYAMDFDISRFEKFSSWTSLRSAFSLLRQMAQQKTFCIKLNNVRVEELKSAERFIIRKVQFQIYSREISKLCNKEKLLLDSQIINLNPFLDHDNILRVGGRLNKSDFGANFNNPIIIPKNTHIATLLVLNYHDKVHHQGRHLTEGALRNAGYWIVGARRLVSHLIHHCVTCRRLRGKCEIQIMADIPSDRLQPAPPFTYIGIDTFGPWEVVARRTRGGIANSKRWATIFTCLVTRAIHIEVIEQLSTSSFINALRRFISLRGPVKEIRSDKGTNFVGSKDFLGIDAINVEEPSIRKFLHNEGTTWIFNPPHASHFGGVWERMIGVVRRILESLMLQLPMKLMTHEVLVTFMAEMCAIVNSRPLVSVSSDPQNPTVLTPSVLLTQKIGNEVTSFGDFDPREMYKSQWKYVQILANKFWKRWKDEYVQHLQTRRKWQVEKPTICENDVVLLKDDSHRIHWPIGFIEKVFPSSDGKVRKVQVTVIRNGQPTTYTRPISEIVFLFSP